MVSKINLVAALLFTFILIGCGGGETATTGINGGTEAPAQDTGQPDPGDFAGIGTAALNWMPPTTYTDGSTFSDLSGHNVYMDSGNGFVKIGSLNSAGVSDYLVENLSVGTYTFSVTAYDSQGIESSFSNTAKITI